MFPNKFVAILLISGIGISVFVFFHLLRQNGIKFLSRRIALSIQLLWLVRFGLYFPKVDNEIINNAYLVIYDQSLFFLDGLLVWLYIRTLLQPERSFKKIWLHFIPFTIVFIYSSVMAVLSPENVIEIYNQNIVKLKQDESLVSLGEIIFITLLILINIIYLVKGVNITKSYNDELKQNLSNIDHLTVNWVQKFQRLWIAFFIVPIVIYFINYMYPILGRISTGNMMMVLFVLLSIILNSFLLEQVYRPISLFTKEKSLENQNFGNEKIKLLEKLESLLKEEQYYLDDELSLGQLAEYMDMKSVELTELIKMSPYENFYDLINSYRIDKVKKQLKETDEQIIQLAYQNGFRSKSTFNKIFKEKTAMTPKEYRLS